MWYKLKRATIRVNGTEKQIRPKSWWQPWVDTLIYYDFEHTTWTTESNQASNSNYNGTYSWTPTIWTLASGKKYFDTEDTYIVYSSNGISDLNYNNSTICVWIKPQSNNGAWFGQRWWWGSWWTIFCETYQWTMNLNLWLENYYISATAPTQDAWHNIVITNNWTVMTGYIDWVSIWTVNVTTTTWNKVLNIGAVSTTDGASSGHTDASFWSVILENKVWTAQEVSDYYNQTKSNYGL